MSAARDGYYKLEADSFLSSNFLIPAVENYIAELEEEKSELIEMLKSISDISMGKIKFDIDKLLQKHEVDSVKFYDISYKGDFVDPRERRKYIKL